MRIPSRLKGAHHFLPWLALGPITGPLAWAMYRSIRTQRHGAAAMWGLAIVCVWVGLGVYSGQALAALTL